LCDDSQCIAIVGDSGKGMMVEGAINGYPVQQLVDTGAAVTLISETLARELGYSELDQDLAGEASPRLCSVDGSTLSVIGTVAVVLRVQEATCVHEVRVVRNLRYACRGNSARQVEGALGAPALPRGRGQRSL